MQKVCSNHDTHDPLEMAFKTKSCIRCSIMEMHVLYQMQYHGNACANAAVEMLH